MSDDVGARLNGALGNRASARQWASFNLDNEALRGSEIRAGSDHPTGRA